MAGLCERLRDQRSLSYPQCYYEISLTIMLSRKIKLFDLISLDYSTPSTQIKALRKLCENLPEWALKEHQI